MRSVIHVCHSVCLRARAKIIMKLDVMTLGLYQPEEFFSAVIRSRIRIPDHFSTSLITVE